MKKIMIKCLSDLSENAENENECKIMSPEVHNLSDIIYEYFDRIFDVYFE